ncbi:hypothetical protein GGG16DRAFT_122606 [Schizophyllum commune]
MANNLPPELLSQILLASLPENWGTSRPFATRLAISHVCRYWRELCLNSPEIWQRVTYEYSNEGCTRRLDEIEPLREYLRRSAGSPLSVALLTGGDDVDMDMEVYGRLFQVQDIWHLVFAESQRWVSARLVRDGRVRIPVPYSKALDVPNLVQFQYICPTNSAYSYALDPSVTFRWLATASSLRRLYLTEPFVPSQTQAPWAQLTHLNLYLVDQASLHECVAILPRCTAVEYLTLSVFTAKWNERFPIVEVPSLQALTLYDDAVYLLCYIHVPNLMRMALRTERLLTVRQYDAFAMLAQRDPPKSLRSLTIQQPLRYPQRLEEMLASVPGLEYLEIKDKCYPRVHPMAERDSTFKCIGRAQTLKALSLQLCMTGWHHPDVVQLLDEELSRLPDLKSLRLWGVPEAKLLDKAEEYESWIDGLHKRGVDVERRQDCMQEINPVDDWAE